MEGFLFGMQLLMHIWITYHWYMFWHPVVRHRNESSMNWFSIITWWGNLTIAETKVFESTGIYKVLWWLANTCITDTDKYIRTITCWHSKAGDVWPSPGPLRQAGTSCSAPASSPSRLVGSWSFLLCDTSICGSKCPFQSCFPYHKFHICSLQSVAWWSLTLDDSWPCVDTGHACICCAFHKAHKQSSCQPGELLHVAS